MSQPAFTEDALLAAGVTRHLSERGRLWSAPVLAYATVDSTSERLRELAHQGAREWTVAVAREQARGRGRRGRIWVSPPGGLYISVLLRPGPDVAAGLLPLAAGVAVAETLAEWGVAAQLKWPNDALAGERKIAGVLVESATGSRGLEHAVLGVGVNLDHDFAQAPELRATSTSVHAEIGRAPEVAPAAAALLDRFTPWYHALARDARGVVAAWRERAAPWWGEPVEVHAGERTLRGRLSAVDDDGALVLATDAGPVKLFSGEVARLRPAPGA